MKTAILQVADTGPLESLVVMLRSVGYECFLPDDRLKGELRRIGCDTVLDVQGLVENWGYSQPMNLPEASSSMMRTVDLYVDVKGHRNGAKVVQNWPELKGKILWYRINGGEPEHVIRRDADGNMTEDCGDEENPPCPILTPNLWYTGHTQAYAMWPPFYRFDDYYSRQGRARNYEKPICLIHNLQGWGYGKLTERIRALGVRCHGRSSPDDLIPHSQVSRELYSALAMVHLKSSDAPGYALYEGAASACPLVISKRLIWRNRMQDLFEPEVTCLTFDRETHEGLTDQDIEECTRDIHVALERLKDPVLNEKIGMAARNRLHELMWSEKKREDVQSLGSFMERMFSCLD